MKVICTKCGGMHVACEAMINPNDKSFRNYTDEAFIYGWCDDCGYGVVLSDVDEVKTDIDKLHADYCAEHEKEPLYAQCEIVWKDESFTEPQLENPERTDHVRQVLIDPPGIILD